MNDFYVILGDSGGGLIIKVWRLTTEMILWILILIFNFLIIKDKDNGRWTIRGIVSAAIRAPDGSCDLENYVIFNDVARHIDWIKRFI